MIGWLDVRAGVSGDLLLGALVDAGVPLEVLQAAVDPLGLGLRFIEDTVTRGGIAATKVSVQAPEDATARTWRDIRALLGSDHPAAKVFARLAEAEGHIHGVDPDDVHFHEVGALDAIADVVGAVAGFAHLGLTRLVCSPVGLGSGTARTAHGTLPVPVPAVLALLTGAPVTSGPAAFESTTPTGAALLATLVDAWGELPPLRITGTGTGAADRDPETHPNVTRLVLGEPLDEALVLETNVDDLEPRLWPAVLQSLLDAGASDAWLTPILMKKGRPAHTLSVLVAQEHAPAVRAVVFRETTTLGLREQTVRKRALDRTFGEVTVDGQVIRVKHGWYDGELVTSQPEWEDVAAAARATGRPVRQVLQEAQTSAKNATAPSPPASGTPTQS